MVRISLKKPQLSLSQKNSSSMMETSHPMIHEKLEINQDDNSLKEDVGNLEKWFNDLKVKILNDENEPNYLTEAKNQIMRKRLESENEKFKKCQEPIVNQNLVNFSIFDNGLESFLENEKNLEKMKEFARKNKKMYTFKDEGANAKKYEPIKSLDAIKQEFRKQILNQIMVDKILRKKKADISTLNSTEALNDPKSIKFESMPSFKCLQKVSFGNMIELDFLKEKINEFQQKPKKMFELGVYEAQFNKITNDLKSLEEILIEKFNDISNDISKKKKMGHKFRNIHSNLTLTMKRLYDEKEVLIGKFNTIEQKLLNSLGDKNEAVLKGGKAKNQMTSDYVKLAVQKFLLLFKSNIRNFEEKKAIKRKRF
jgi:hypothetical protein